MVNGQNAKCSNWRGSHALGHAATDIEKAQGEVPVEWKEWSDELHFAYGKLTRLRSSMQVVGSKTLITFGGNPYYVITYRLMTRGLGCNENGGRAREGDMPREHAYPRPPFILRRDNGPVTVECEPIWIMVQGHMAYQAQRMRREHF
jgi:hypothetical protein